MKPKYYLSLNLSPHRHFVEYFCTVGFLVHFLLFYPGSMSVDSWNQYNQALAGVYSDWHPPTMAFFWRLVAVFWPGPAGMLLIHLSIFWYALYRFASGLNPRDVFLKIMVIVAGLSPMVTGILGAIWKDIGAATFSLLAYSYLTYPTRQKIWGYAFAAVLFTYAIAVRRNGIFMTLPGFLFLGFSITKIWLQYRSPVLKYGLPIFMGLATAALILKSVMLFETKVLHSTREHLEQSVYFHDLATLDAKNKRPDSIPSLFRSENYSDQKVSKALEDMRCMDPLIYGSDPPYRVLRQEEYLQSLIQIWVRAVLEDPTLYLEHRFSMLKSLVGWSVGSCRIHSLFFGQEFGSQFRISSRLQEFYLSAIEVTDNYTPFFKAWFWLLVGLTSIIIAFTRQIRAKYGALLLVSSSWIYILGYVPIAVCCDYRYVWLACPFSLIALFMSIQKKSIEVEARSSNHAV